MNCAFEFESKGGLIQHFFFQDLRVWYNDQSWPKSLQG
jgi:hypothetical protein